MPGAYSEACERNRGPILDVLRDAFADARHVLEIGSGTGQHAVHFAAGLAHAVWQPSDLPEHHPSIAAWRADGGLPNLRAPLALDVNDADWLPHPVDAIFSANTLHILSWASVEALFRGVARTLTAGGTLAIYGPFRYGGRHTAESNARFDAFLRARDPLSGIRDAESVDVLARAAGLTLVGDVDMPANNRTRVWKKSPAA